MSSSLDDVNKTGTGYTSLQINENNLASGHLFVIFTVAGAMLIYMFLFNRWRALKAKKQQKHLKLNRVMLMRTNKGIPKEMMRDIYLGYGRTTDQRQQFAKTVPIGAQQHGYGDPALSKCHRWKKKVASTALALEKIFGYDAKCRLRGPTESIVDFGHRLAKMLRYREMASVIRSYVDKYEAAKFSKVEMSEDDLNQTEQYLQQALDSISRIKAQDSDKLKHDQHYGLDIRPPSFTRADSGHIRRPSKLSGGERDEAAGLGSSGLTGGSVDGMDRGAQEGSYMDRAEREMSAYSRRTSGFDASSMPLHGLEAIHVEMNALSTVPEPKTTPRRPSW